MRAVATFKALLYKLQVPENLKLCMTLTCVSHYDLLLVPKVNDIIAYSCHYLKPLRYKHISSSGSHLVWIIYSGCKPKSCLFAYAGEAFLYRTLSIILSRIQTI